MENQCKEYTGTSEYTVVVRSRSKIMIINDSTSGKLIIPVECSEFFHWLKNIKSSIVNIVNRSPHISIKFKF